MAIAVVSALLVLLGCEGKCNFEHDYCEGAILHSCLVNDTYAEPKSTDCSTTAQVCVEATEGGSPTAFCAASSAPDPRCAEPGPASRCDQNLRLRCLAGYLLTSEDCGTEQCRLPNGSQEAVCMDLEDPCLTLADGWHCTGDTGRRCAGQQTIDFTICPGCSLDERSRPVNTNGGSC